MSKQDKTVGNERRKEITRRATLTLAAAVATFGAALGMRASPAWAQDRIEGKLEGKVKSKAEGKLEGKVKSKAEAKLEGKLQSKAEGKVQGKGAEAMTNGKLSTTGNPASPTKPNSPPAWNTNPAARR
jgi:uncharacterized protein (DUF2147 family)